MGARPVPRERVLECHRHQQLPPLHAVLPPIVEQAAGSREPAARAGELAAVHQDEHDPAGAPGRAPRVTAFKGLAMRTLPELDAVLVPAEQIRRRGEPLEVLRLERSLAIGSRELGEGIRPRSPLEGLPAPRVCRGRLTPVARHECIVRSAAALLPTRMGRRH